MSNNDELISAISGLDEFDRDVTARQHVFDLLYGRYPFLNQLIHERTAGGDRAMHEFLLFTVAAFRYSDTGHPVEVEKVLTEKIDKLPPSEEYVMWGSVCTLRKDFKIIAQAMYTQPSSVYGLIESAILKNVGYYCG